MKIIVGLGNPGDKYKNTKHNIGFMFLDSLLVDKEVSWKKEKKFDAEMVKVGVSVEGLKGALSKLGTNESVVEKISDQFAEFFSNEAVILVKPQTFMNRSGKAVSSIASYFDVVTEDILVIHDDIDIKKGELKFQKDRGAAGHNGVQDIIDSLGSNNFSRLRIGVGKPDAGNKRSVKDWVLSKL